MRSLKQFWPLYILYAAELAIYVVICGGAIGAQYGAGAMDADARAEMLADGSLHFMLVSPVILGFFFRRYFIKGLWLAYVWVYVFLYPVRDWTDVAIVLGHAIVVTTVLLFSSAGRTYFRTPSEGKNQDEQKEPEGYFERPAAAFLRMRLRKLDATRSPDRTFQYRLMQGYWIGFALVVWGLVLKLTILASPGFVLLIVCFLLHRRLAGDNGIFFRGRFSIKR